MFSGLIITEDTKLAENLQSYCAERNIICEISKKIENPVSAVEDILGIKYVFLELVEGLEKAKKNLEKILLFNNDFKVILLAQNFNVKEITSLLRYGAYDCLSLPLDPIELAASLDTLENSFDVSEYNENKYPFIIGKSLALQKTLKMVDKVAKSDSTVLIYGESGTGKELIARALHEGSPRKDKTIIPVNCGAIPEELLEAELFGHVKGAFTNAIKGRLGRFEMADNSTIFLDEIANMSPNLQVKLLRVLQEHAFEKVGSDVTVKVNIRVVAATNIELSTLVESGEFREDLYYRLNVIPIVLPPLREREGDVAILISFFLKRYQKTKGTIVEGFSKKALERLLVYSWPGNVRELENLLERLFVLADSKIIELEDLPNKILEKTANIKIPSNLISQLPNLIKTKKELINPNGKTEENKTEENKKDVFSKTWEFPEEGVNFNEIISQLEDNLILKALELSGGVKNKAAQLLSLNRTTLVEKIKKKKLED